MPDNDCPFCSHPKPWPKPLPECVIGKPIHMVIPYGGVHLPCPAHPEGHHIHGPGFTLSTVGA